MTAINLIEQHVNLEGEEYQLLETLNKKMAHFEAKDYKNIEKHIEKLKKDQRFASLQKEETMLKNRVHYLKLWKSIQPRPNTTVIDFIINTYGFIYFHVVEALFEEGRIVKDASKVQAYQISSGMTKGKEHIIAEFTRLIKFTTPKLIKVIEKKMPGVDHKTIKKLLHEFEHELLRERKWLFIKVKTRFEQIISQGRSTGGSMNSMGQTGFGITSFLKVFVNHERDHLIQLAQKV